MSYSRRGFSATKKMTPLERLYYNVAVNVETRCWEWLAHVIPAGYGQLSIGARQQEYAHRLSYQLHVGPIPDGLQIDHLCRNRRCVNPEHLEAVTPLVNTNRGADARWQERASRPA